MIPKREVRCKGVDRYDHECINPLHARVFSCLFEETIVSTLAQLEILLFLHFNLFQCKNFKKLPPYS